MSDDERGKVVAVLGCGLLSSVLEEPVDIRQEPRKLSDLEFDFMVKSLYDQGLIARDTVENDYLQ
jgi:hypothetical protein